MSHYSRKTNIASDSESSSTESIHTKTPQMAREVKESFKDQSTTKTDTPLSEPSWPRDWALVEIPTDLESSDHGNFFEITPRVLPRSPGASRSRFISSSFSVHNM